MSLRHSFQGWGRGQAQVLEPLVSGLGWDSFLPKAHRTILLEQGQARVLEPILIGASDGPKKESRDF